MPDSDSDSKSHPSYINTNLFELFPETEEIPD